MDPSFYTAAVGAEMQQKRLSVHANNIAGINTYGFRSRIPAFSALMTGKVKGTEKDLARGVGALLEDSESDFRSSGFTETGRATDFAIDGEGFFALQDPLSGEITYTRDGSFILSNIREDGREDKVWREGEEATWVLTDGEGRYVLSRTGAPIEVTVKDTNELKDYPFNVGLFDFVNKNGMKSLNDNRHVQVDKNGQAIIASGKVVQGYLETSNVDLGTELAKVIEAQRSFQYMLRMVTTSDEIQGTINNLR